jgi:methylated-DNA-[protein]-cysteine S-methyltransferase
MGITKPLERPTTKKKDLQMPGTTGTTAATARKILAAAVRTHTNATPATPFQLRVYLALCQVPAGSVTTYKDIGTHIGCKSSQAVGQALRRNPMAPDVPCHRVLAASGGIGGFSGTTVGAKINKKRQMLRDEGVRFQDNGRVDPACVYRFASISFDNNKYAECKDQTNHSKSRVASR